MSTRTRSVLRALVATFVAAVLLPLAAQAESPAPPESVGPSVGDKVFDAAVLRPFGFITTIIGVVFFLPAALVSIPNGPDGREEAWDVLVGESVESTFRRPLGEF